MALHFCVHFPFSEVVLSPADISPASKVSDLANFNLRRRLRTTNKAARQAYVLALTPSPDAQNPVNFVGIIGCNLTGDATVKLRQGANELASETLGLVAGKPSWLLFAAAHATCDEIEITFPQTVANGRLECALVVAGNLMQPRKAPAGVERLTTPLHFEIPPEGTGAAAPEHGKYETLRLSWDKLVGDDKRDVENLIANSNDFSAIVVRDDARSGNDALLFGAIRGPLTISSAQFTDLVEPTLTIDEVLAL